MRRYGWIDAYPMHTVRSENGKLKIKAGHHRFTVAKKLGIAVKFVVCDDDDISIQELERTTNQWSLKDYLKSFVHSGKEAYITVKEYHERTGINLTSSISMLGGQAAASTNLQIKFKNGSFCLGDPTHAGIIADLVSHCKKCGIIFATHNLFVQALSKVAWVEQFDINRLKHKISVSPSLLEKQATLALFIDVLEMLYNRQCKDKVPLAFLANEKARERQERGFRET